MVETIFDTLNAKAALFAHRGSCSTRSGYELPVMISGTITDQSGRTLSGQTTEAFWNSVAHAKPFSVGLNCALGAEADAPVRRRAVARRRHARLGAIRMPACRTSSAGTTRTPRHMAAISRIRGKDGLVNIVGGCCGTTPGHIRCIAEGVKGLTPRGVPVREHETAPVRPRTVRGPGGARFDRNFINVGERTNVTGSARFAKLILNGEFDAALAGRAPAGRERRAGHRHQHGRGHARRKPRWRASSI